ncbi:hypothetical protein [Aureivirga marina]|uniref:hypothetical protein n=1 Tax=Aureivirga marina TaxID=1182451 RepID=UPI0018CA6E7A|nr:hypothetical protein [Aureivirga marina]
MIKKGETLGAKKKIFNYQISQDGSICIWRKFKSDEEPRSDIFSKEELKHIFKKLEKLGNPFFLANSVSKLKDGEEKEGIGKIVYDYEMNQNSTTKAQATSQLVAIFYELGILSTNGKKRNIEFTLHSNFETYLQKIKKL